MLLEIDSQTLLKIGFTSGTKLKNLLVTFLSTKTLRTA